MGAVRRAQFKRLVLHVPATGEVVDTTRFLAEPLADSPEYFDGDDGAQALLSRARTLDVLLLDAEDARTVRAWRASGARVKAVLVGAVGAVHLVWAEAVPVGVREGGARWGAWSGVAVRLATRKLAARIIEDHDTLQEAALTDGSIRLGLPLPGVLVTVTGAGADQLTLTVRDHDLVQIETTSAAGEIWMVLPAGVYYLDVATDGDLPALTLNIAGYSVQLVSSTADYARYDLRGVRGQERIETLSFLGTDYDLTIVPVDSRVVRDTATGGDTLSTCIIIDR